LTYGTITNVLVKYKLQGDRLSFVLRQTGTLGGSASDIIYNTLPWEILQSANSPALGYGGTAGVAAQVLSNAATPDQIAVRKYDGSNYATSGTCVNSIAGMYQI
jgi:hypothetical protein